MTNKIKPCPFCGSRAKYAAGGNVPGFVIGCTNEKCHEFILQQTAHYDEVMEAIEAWNTRAERTCHDEFNGKAWCFKCNSCGCVIPWKDSFNNEPIRGGLLHYCPNCGARVVE